MNLTKKPFIVAEIGAAHSGRLDIALQLCDEAKHAGADAIKIQTWHEMTVSNERLVGGAWDGRLIQELYDEARTPLEWHWPIFERCADLGIQCFSTPFDRESVDFLEGLGSPAYKVASFEIVDLDLIRYAGATGKTIIISTGMATEFEIEQAISAVGHEDFIVLKCTSAYPAPADQLHLSTMPDIAMMHRCRVGLSDHTQGTVAAVVAAAMGATVIEKHIGLDDSSLDGGFCTKPREFKRMVDECRIAAQVMGVPTYGPTNAEAPSMKLRRSMWVVADIALGEEFTDDNVRCVRPSGGIYPAEWPIYRGERASRACARGEPFVSDMVDKAKG